MAVDPLDESVHIQDALNIALEKEKEAVLFYTHGVEISTDAGVKKLFQELAEEEKSHVKRIQNIIEQEIMQEM